MLKTTPFFPRTAPLVQGQAWRRWAGHSVASAYELQHDREYASVRSSAALFDVSPLYKYLISGRDALRLLDRMVTRDLRRCRVGQVMYTPWCNDRGKVVDDGTVSRLAEDRFRLTSAEPNLRWLALSGAGMEVALEDVSAVVVDRDSLDQLVSGTYLGKFVKSLADRFLDLEVQLQRMRSSGA